MIITISGETGAGKSTFAKLLAKKIGAEVVCVDEVISMLYECNTKFCKSIVCWFGEGVCVDGKIDKHKVGKLVFSNKENQETLRIISAPFIAKAIKFALEKNENIIVEYKFAPLLNVFDEADCNILLVATNNRKRKNLVAKRDGLPNEYLKARDKNTIDFYKYDFNFTYFHNYESFDDIVDYVAGKLQA